MGCLWITSRAILGASHLLFLGAIALLYFDRLIAAGILGFVAWFVRMMAPYPKKMHPNDGIWTRSLRGMHNLGWVFVFFFLVDLGLDDWMRKVWEARHSTKLAAGVILLVTSAAVKDWAWILRLSSNDVDAFYGRKAEP